MRKTVAAVAALPLIGLLGVATPASAATTLDVVSATVASGRTLDVTLAVNCDPADFPDTEFGLPDAVIGVSFSQQVGGTVLQDAAGEIYDVPNICTGETEIVTIQLSRTPGERGAFKKDDEALVRVTLSLGNFEIDEAPPFFLYSADEETITVQ